MNKVNKIIKVIKENPDCIIYYYDAQRWLICTNQEMKLAEKEGRDVNEIIAGDDFDSYDYAPEIVTVLAKMLGIKVMSV